MEWTIPSWIFWIIFRDGILPSFFLTANDHDGILPSPSEKEVFSMTTKVPRNKPPPRSTRYVSPAEQAWLNRINRQLAYDEYMQAKRELWLAERPSSADRRKEG